MSRVISTVISLKIGEFVFLEENFYMRTMLSKLNSTRDFSTIKSVPISCRASENMSPLVIQRTWCSSVSVAASNILFSTCHKGFQHALQLLQGDFCYPLWKLANYNFQFSRSQKYILSLRTISFIAFNWNNCQVSKRQVTVAGQLWRPCQDCL